MLVLEGVGQFVSHDHALIAGGTPVRDIEFLRLGIVQPFDLLREHVHHKGVEVEPLRQQAKCFGGARIGIALSRILFFAHLLDDIRTNLFARPQGFFQRREQLQSGDFAHLLEHFIRSGKELGIISGFGIRSRGCRSAILRARGRTEQTDGKKKTKNGESTLYPFCDGNHVQSRITEPGFSRPKRYPRR